MLKFLSQALSVIFHPLLLTSYALLLIFLLPGYLSMLPYSYKRTVFIVFSLITSAAPAVFVFLMYQLKVIQNLSLEDRKERIFPLVTSFIFYLSAYIMALRFPVELPNLVLGILLTAALSSLAGLLLNFILKVSLHSLAFAAFISFFTSYIFLFQINAVNFIIALILLSGITAAARLFLNSHKPLEIYTGFLVGAALGLMPHLIQLHF
jgi:hypothetical protein